MHMPTREVFRHRLILARDAARLSQSQLAERAGLQPAAVSHFETGQRVPNAENLVRLSVALGQSVDYLLAIRPDSDAERVARIRAAQLTAPRSS